jgi:hypothetical protein
MDWKRRDNAVAQTKLKILTVELFVRIYKNLVYAEKI